MRVSQLLGGHDEMSALAQRCADLNVLFIEGSPAKDSPRFIQKAAGGNGHADRPTHRVNAADLFNGSPSAMVEFVRTVDAARTARATI